MNGVRNNRTYLLQVDPCLVLTSNPDYMSNYDFPLINHLHPGGYETNASTPVRYCIFSLVSSEKNRKPSRYVSTTDNELIFLRATVTLLFPLMEWTEECLVYSETTPASRSHTIGGKRRRPTALVASSHHHSHYSFPQSLL